MDIKIAVACHKPSELPDNPLYVPVQVGSALAAKRLDGMLHDDEGDNISEKNPYYCELTAQYWAWKHFDADYVGLCHYRRFLTFPEGSYELDERNQIQAGVIDDFNMAKYGLLDEDLMRRVIEDNDMVVGELEDVSGLYTPHGEQKTAYLHWAKHDRALIREADLQAMMAIVDEKYPELGAEMREYLDDKYFLGYNCFVMKRALFDELCSFEFDVLEELERRVDLTYYNQTLSRIYGFMAEILYSTFVYHYEKRGAKVKHLPLVYFNYTDPIESLVFEPVEGAIPVVICAYYKVFEAVLDVTVRSFLDHTNPQSRYDLIVVHEQASASLLKALKDQVKAYGNVTLRFLDAKVIEGALDDRLGCRSELVLDKPERLGCDLRAFLPWIFGKYDALLYFEWTVLFQAPVDELWAKVPKDKCLAAAMSLDEQARINDPYEDRDAYVAETLRMENPYRYFDTVVMAMNLEKMRDPRFLQQITEFYFAEDYRIRHMDVLNAVYSLDTEQLGFEWDWPVIMNDWRKLLLPQAPLKYFSQYKAAGSNAKIKQYQVEDPWHPIGSDADVEFWALARRGVMYETLLASMMDRRFEVLGYKTKRNFSTIMFTSLFPSDSPRRKKIESMCPEGSLRRRFLNHMC